MSKKPKVDQDICIACGTCVTICPEVFEMDESNKSKIKEGDHSALEEKIQSAIDGCPVQAISLEE